MSLLFKNASQFSNILAKRCLSSIKVPKSISRSLVLTNFLLKEGARLPSVVVYENTPANKINVTDLFKGKKGILFGVPGAFTPGCSKTHLPGYVQNYEQIKAKGYDVIACVSVNDPFVMEAWGKSQNVGNKVRVLADTNAELTKALGLSKDLAVLGGVRSLRYTLIIQDNVVKKAFVEPDGTGLTCSLADNVLKNL